MEKINIPNFIKNDPNIAVIISKLNHEKDNPKNLSSLTNGLKDVSDSIKEKISNNDNILQLFPDIEIIVQILCSSIISPNDMFTNNIVYENPNINIPSEFKSSITDIIKTHIKTEYNLEDKLYNILKETLFLKGAYCEAIIPESILDDVINVKNRDGMVSIENKINTLSNNKFGFLSNEVNEKNIDISLENINNKTEIITYSNNDLLIEFTDNPSILHVNKEHINNLLNNDLLNNEISLEDDVKIELDSFFKNNKNYKTENIIEVNDSISPHRESIGKPLCIKLPAESVIPVHTVNDVSKHLGYFILLDENGMPIDVYRYNKNNDKANDDILSSNTLTDQHYNNISIIEKARKSLYGITGKDKKLNNIEELYSYMVEKMIKKRLSNGKFGDLVDIQDNADIYRTMLSRALKAKKTKLLFLPRDLVVYYAFEYRDNGTGKSLLEKTHMLYSIKSILLFSNIMANVKNSVNTTEVSVDLDEMDEDVVSSMNKIKSEILKTKQTQLPIGLLDANGLTGWLHKFGYRFKWKHKDLPDVDIDVNDTNSNKIVPDTDLIDKIDENITMSFGLTMDMVRSGYDSDFATSVVSKNLLLAKRIVQHQNTFIPLITQHVRKIVKNDNVLIDKIKDYINNKGIMKDIIKNFNKKKIKVSKQDITTYIIKIYQNEIKASLPRPEMSEAQSMKDAFDSYKTTIEDYVDYIISDEAIPNELAGDLSDKLESVKAIIKTMLMKKWLSENGHMTELNEFLTRDEDANRYIITIS
jgi:hypothetical protein